MGAHNYRDKENHITEPKTQNYINSPKGYNVLEKKICSTLINTLTNESKLYAAERERQRESANSEGKTSAPSRATREK